MPLFRRVLTRLSEEILLLLLLAALGPLLWVMPEQATALPRLVDWKTVGALAGLMVLSRGLEESGYLAHSGQWLLQRIRGERMLAVTLVLFSAALSAVITNDVALFIVVPLTISLHRVAELPIGRLVIFEALAVNAGSALSPVGNPQNLFLWQDSKTGFLEFLVAMLPLAACLLLLLLALIPLGFPRQRIVVTTGTVEVPLDRQLLAISLVLYPIFLLLTDHGWAVQAAAGVVALYLVLGLLTRVAGASNRGVLGRGMLGRGVLAGVDWLLLVVFMLMFIDLGLLAQLPVWSHLAPGVASLPGGVMTAGVLLSQLISNVPAAIFLEQFSDDWRLLAWGVSVGGFGVALGSLANLIALRLARQPGLWREFHKWSLAMLIGGYLVAIVLLAVLPQQ